MHRPSPAPDLDAVALLDRAVAYTRGSLQLVAPPVLSRPTPCEGWDVLALLRHMDDSLAAFTEAAEIGYVALVPVDAPESEVLVSRLRLRACALLGAWFQDRTREVVSVGGRPLGPRLLAAAGALELTVHGWDLARGCGHDRPVPAPLAERLLDVVPLVVAEADRPTRFGPAFDVPLRASSPDRLLAALGRRPR